MMRRTFASILMVVVLAFAIQLIACGDSNSPGGGGTGLTPDTDGDGVPDADDLCPGTPAGDPVDADGCSTVDGDGDGVGNDEDECPGTAMGEPVDADGCSTADDDGDGVGNDADECPGTAAGDSVDASGCSTADDDGDGVLNDQDECPQVPGPAVANGCPDADEDGVQNDDDFCPNTQSHSSNLAKSVVGPDGCSIDQICPCHGGWDNRGDYVSCVAAIAEYFWDSSLISRSQGVDIIDAAAQTSCGA